jgi:hypothetical protein
MTDLTAITASSFINSLGVNTHIDFGGDGYQNLAAVESALQYLGVPNVRDSAQTSADLSSWLQVSQATGVKFDDYLPEGSPGEMQNAYNLISQLAQEGVLNMIEGGNEEDDSYPTSVGNSLGYTAQFQQQVYDLGQSLGLGVINMSFGAGWTAANNWIGDYGSVGDLSAWTDYGNAHTYPMPGQTTNYAIQTLNSDARLAASSVPVITTEMGWDANTFGQAAVAQYVVQAALDSMMDGDARTYFYALFDDNSGAFGLMNSDGSPQPAGTALHNLTTLLSDTGASFTPGSLSFTLNGAESTDNTLLFQKSDGSGWLALWDESAGTHTVTLNLAATASEIEVYDPVTGTSAIASAGNTNSISVSLGNDPLLIEVIPSGGLTATAGGSGTGSSTASGSSGSADPSGGSSAAVATASGSGPDPVISAPASQTVAPGSTATISGVSLSDAWAAGNPGTLALNVTATGGTVAMQDGYGDTIAGSGTSGIATSGTLSQINADLQTLSYTADSSGGSVTVNIWDQKAAQASETIDTTASGSTTTGDAGGGTTGDSGTNTTSSATIAAADATPVEVVNDASITATSGDHMIFIGGTQDVLTATGGTETVQAYQGGNTITTGAGDDTIRFAGSNNVINAGGGNNDLMDSGNNDTIVLPGANQGYDDMFGYMMTNGDQFDLRSLLASTSWDGDASTIGNYVSVADVNNSAVISVDPTGVAGGASSVVATLESTGPIPLSTLLAHSIT